RAPRRPRPAAGGGARVKLALRELRIAFGGRVVVDIDAFGVDEQEIVGLVGAAGASLSGSITLDGRELVGLDERQLRDVRGRRIAAIFQSPLSSFSPVFRVGDVFVRALRLHGV